MLKNKRFSSTFKKSDTIEANPMDGVSNMSDAMLVLAVGIMLALVINWKIDIGQKNNTTINSKMEEVDIDKDAMSKNVSNDEFESDYVETGKVYTDKKTGKTYIVID